jgi:transcriptional regulator with XRE-family HTH domain
MPYNKERVGNRLAALRKDKGMTQEELAKASGVSLNSIARYETADTSMGLDAAFDLTEALGCTLDQLVCRGNI